MEKHETTQLLSIASQFDGRQVDALTVEAWHGVIGDLAYEPALRALNDHYRTERKWIMPSQIVDGVHTAERNARWARQEQEEQALYARQREELEAADVSERQGVFERQMQARYEMQARHREENDVLGIYPKKCGDWMNPEIERVPIRDEWLRR